ncbi:MAG: hypothetical protein R3E32_19605 [Chitinophagales bacterium]
MKNLTLTLLLLSTTVFTYAQQKAITQTGQEVLLYEDGTWAYLEEDSVEVVEIPMNPTEFETPKKSTFLLKSSKIDLGFGLNPKKWNFKKATNNDEAEYELQLKEGDLYGMIITEKIEIPLDVLKKIALENGRAVSPDLKIVKEEYRMVNGIKVLLLQMNGTLQSIKFSYYGYYYSDEGGTIQFITYTAQNMMDEYRTDAEDLLNGLVRIKE